VTASCEIKERTRCRQLSQSCPPRWAAVVAKIAIHITAGTTALSAPETSPQSSFDNLDAMTAVYAAVVTLLSQKRHGQIFEGVVVVASSSLSRSGRCQDLAPGALRESEFSSLATPTPLMKCLAQDTLRFVDWRSRYRAIITAPRAPIS
jgi:hypothetical protein